MRLIVLLVLALVLIQGLASCVSSYESQPVKRVYQDNVTGYDFDEYKLQLKVNDRLSTHIDVRQLDVVLFDPINLTMENDKSVIIEESGEYTLRVLMPRAFARRGESYDYHLLVKVEKSNNL